MVQIESKVESSGNAKKLEMMIDSQRVRHCILFLSGACWAAAWLICFVLGYMGSRSSLDGVTAASLLRTTLYSLPGALILAGIFPFRAMIERQHMWAVDEDGIEVYKKDELILSVRWGDVDDIVFREYSVGIHVRNHTPSEHNILLPSPQQCDELSLLYNKSKGMELEMDRPN